MTTPHAGAPAPLAQAPSVQAPVARDPVEELAEAFLERYRRGERPPLSEFIARAPEHAQEIRELFPALVLMEQADPAASALKPPADCNLERLGDYHLLREVGRGGMGIVYEAEQEALGRRVALKILPLSAATDAKSLMRFRREARSAARLHHTNIVPVFDIGEREGVHYYAMQFIQGQGLDEVITELHRLRRLPTLVQKGAVAAAANGGATGLAASLADGLMSGNFRAADLAAADLAAEAAPPTVAPAAEPAAPSASRLDSQTRRDTSSAVLTDRSDFTGKAGLHFYRSVARVGLQVAEALAYAHGQRVLHRDIKPGNLLLDAAGCVWVTDFGLAKEEGDDLTGAGDIVGTLRYMAPERLSGQSDTRSDIYGLGITLYELLTLEPAFAETDRARLVHCITRQEPAPPRKLDPQTPRDLETIILKAIAKEPGRRYTTAGDMAEDLQRFLTDRPIRARRASQLERGWRWCRRNPGWASTIAAALSLLLLTAVGGAVMSLHLRQALSDAQAADEQKTDKLWQSLLERARALRSSGRVGQRFEALAAIREAAKIKVTTELRDEAVAALALPDVELAREWDAGEGDATELGFDAKFERGARINRNNEITVYRLTAHGEEVIGRAPIQGEGRTVISVMSPDGRFLAIGYAAPQALEAGSVRIMKLDAGAPALHFEEPKGVHLHALSFHPDGRHVAIGHQDGTISVYDLETKALANRLRVSERPLGLAFHPRELRLAVACRDSIRIFDVTTAEECPRFRNATGIKNWSFGLAWHPEGRVLATVSAAAVWTEATIHLWDTQTAEQVVRPLEGHGQMNVHISFNAAGDRILGASLNDHACLWDAVTGRLLLTMPGPGSQFGPDVAEDSSSAGPLIGIQKKGNKLRLWRLADGRELRLLLRPKGHSGDFQSTVLDADDRIMAAWARGYLCFFDLDSGRELASIHLPKHGALPRRFDPATGWMTSGTPGLLLWPAQRDPDRADVVRVGPPRLLAETMHIGSDATAGGIRVIPQGVQTLVLDDKQPGRRLFLKRQNDVRYAAVSPDGRWVGTFNWWRVVPVGASIWEAATGRHVADLAVQDEASGSFSPDSRWLATNARHQGFQLWEVGTWRPGLRFPEVYGACWSPNKRWLAISDAMSVIRLVDPDTGREALKLTGPAATWYYPACFTSDSAKLIALSRDAGALHVWDLRLIRRQLRELGMDWDVPEFPPAPVVEKAPPVVEVDPGMLRRPLLDNNHHAVAALSVALTLAPVNPEAYLQRGLAYGRLSDHRRAIADYRRFLELTPKSDRRRPEILVRLATNYDKVKEPDNVVATLAQTLHAPIELIPQPEHCAKLCNEVAWRFVKPEGARFPDAVLDVIQQALRLEPCNILYVNTHGVALYRLGRYEEAIRCLEKNLEHSQALIAFDLYFLAMSHERLGRPAEARACLERANASVAAEKGLSPEYRHELAVFRAEAEAVLGISKTKPNP